MEIDLTDDQRLLVDASARFIDDVHPLSALRAAAYSDADFRARYRRQAGELGWFSLAVGEEHGGGSVSGNGVLDAAVVAHTRGRSLQPGAFVATNVVAKALSDAGSAEQRAEVLPALMAGEAAASWAIAAAPGNPVLGGPIRATPSAGDYVLSGRATFVDDDGPTSWLLVTAAADDGPSQFLLPIDTPGLNLLPRGSLDLSRRFAEVDLEGVVAAPSSLLGAVGQASEQIADQLALACVLLTAESIGAMDAEFEMTVQYAKDRIAFGRPIGSFQAIKHALADTSVALEMAKSLVLAAARHVGEGTGYGREAATMAKSFVGDAGVDLAQSCFQIFGGIGFTWEHDQHLYLRRLTTDAAWFGDPAWHREYLCVMAGV